jgi:SAM-dependent methyltransferase
MMGIWSRKVGEVFLDWLALPQHLSWLDIGCGNGAFTELLAQRYAPSNLHGLDSSAEQIAYAMERPSTKLGSFQVGNALALPFEAHQFDAATMALVIFFLPDPAKGVAEMARVVKPGGSVSAYAWDIIGGGSPIEPIRAEMRALGLTPAHAPADDASRTDTMRELWLGAGLVEVQTCQIVVERAFPDFEDFWTTTLQGSILGPAVGRMAPIDRERLRQGVKARLGVKDGEQVRYSARANAVQGRRPR